MTTENKILDPSLNAAALRAIYACAAIIVELAIAWQWGII